MNIILSGGENLLVAISVDPHTHEAGHLNHLTHYAALMVTQSAMLGGQAAVDVRWAIGEEHVAKRHGAPVVCCLAHPQDEGQAPFMVTQSLLLNAQGMIESMGHACTADPYGIDAEDIAGAEPAANMPSGG